MLDGLPPLLDVADEDVYNEAWVGRKPTRTRELDRIVLEELDRFRR